MKCSSRRNCNRGRGTGIRLEQCLNEVQFPKELQLALRAVGQLGGHGASMKCSSRRNCNSRLLMAWDQVCGLNEVQFPKELQPHYDQLLALRSAASMKCSSRRNCNLAPDTFTGVVDRPQ